MHWRGPHPLPSGSLPRTSASDDRDFAAVGWIIVCVISLCLTLGGIYLAASIIIDL